MFDAAEAALLDFPQRPDDRLRLALRRLDAALEDQAAAVSALRQGLRALNGAVAGLDERLAEYRGALDGAATAAASATTQARRLEATAAALAP